MSQTQRMLDHRAAERQARAAREVPMLPLPEMPAVVFDVGEVYTPGAARTALNRAMKHGWWTALHRAIGPRINARGEVPEGDEAVRTISLACARRRERIVYVWRFRPRTGKWELDQISDEREAIIDNKEATRRVSNGA